MLTARPAVPPSATAPTPTAPIRRRSASAPLRTLVSRPLLALMRAPLATDHLRPVAIQVPRARRLKLPTRLRLVASPSLRAPIQSRKASSRRLRVQAASRSAITQRPTTQARPLSANRVRLPEVRRRPWARAHNLRILAQQPSAMLPTPAGLAVSLVALVRWLRAITARPRAIKRRPLENTARLTAFLLRHLAMGPSPSARLALLLARKRPVVTASPSAAMRMPRPVTPLRLA